MTIAGVKRPAPRWPCAVHPTVNPCLLSWWARTPSAAGAGVRSRAAGPRCRRSRKTAQAP